MLKSSGQVKGTVNLVLRGSDNRVKQHKTIRNKVMDNGLAHIVGRMIDHKQNGGAFSTTGLAVNSANAALQQHDTPRMMRYMGIGVGAEANSVAAAAVGSEFRLQNEITTGNNASSAPQRHNRVTGLAGSVVDIEITNPGSGYTSVPTVTIGAPGAGGVQAIFLATIHEGEIASIVATTKGTGYTGASAPTALTISGGGGSGAQATAYIGYSATSAISNQASTATRKGRVDMGATTIDTMQDPTAYNIANWAALRPTGANSSASNTGAQQQGVVLNASKIVGKSSVTNLFQGDLNASGTLEASTGTSEYKSDSNINTTTTTGTVDEFPWQTTYSGTYNSKRTGKKLVYIALFPPNSPRNKHDDGSSPDSDAITEAGIFNSPYFGNVKNDASKEHPFDIETAGGTMLCRTVFNQVNKYKEDSLQITWTIDFSDNTAV